MLKINLELCLLGLRASGMIKEYDYKVLTRVFEPKSIAIIGASPKPGKIGNMVLRNIVQSGYKGSIYPVNPRHDKIMGFKSYKSILDINDEVDLCIISIPAPKVPDVLLECGKHRVAGAVIFASGFSEHSEEGRYLEYKLLEIARTYGIRVIGPNCMGFFNAEINLNATFSPGITADLIRKGRSGYAAFISQSGALSTAILLEAASQGIFFNMFFTLGNKVDVDESDLLVYLSRKDGIRVVGIYLEGFSEGRGRVFIELSRKVGRRKPIVVVKTGKTIAGSRAVRSHTGSLAGDYILYRAMFKQANIIEANSLRELLSFTKLTRVKYPLNGDRVMIISGSGGAAVLATDALEANGVKVEALPQEVINELRSILNVPPYASINNPLDLTFEGMTKENFVRSIEYLSMKGIADVFLVCLIGSRALEVADALVEIIDEVRKPIIVTWTGKVSKEIKEKASFLDENGIPVFDFPDEAASLLGRYINYLKRSRFRR